MLTPDSESDFMILFVSLPLAAIVEGPYPATDQCWCMECTIVIVIKQVRKASAKRAGGTRKRK